MVIGLIIPLRTFLGLFTASLVLFEAEFDDAGDKGEWNRLVERELKVAFGPGIRRDLFEERGVFADRWKDADVVFEGGEVDEYAVLEEGGHAVADFFGGFWSGFFDRGADFFEDGADFGWEGGDVGVDGVGGRSGFHGAMGVLCCGAGRI